MLIVLIAVLAVAVVVLIVMTVTRKPDIDYFATSAQPSETMGMLLTRTLAAAGYQGAAIELRSSIYVPSAVAMIHDGKNYILYNPRTMALADRAGFKTVAQVALLAREVGHLVDCTDSISSPPAAVRHCTRAVDAKADTYCGYVLARFTNEMNDCVDAQRFLLMVTGTPDEGDLRLHIEAVANGWGNGGGDNPRELKRRLESRLIPELQSFRSWW